MYLSNLNSVPMRCARPDLDLPKRNLLRWKGVSLRQCSRLPFGMASRPGNLQNWPKTL